MSDHSDPEIPAIPAIRLSALRDYISDRAELAKGAQLYDDGQLSQLARHKNKIFCDAAGAGQSPYKVAISFSKSETKARCSCFAARNRPFCKHAAGLLVAWSRAPESFVLAESGPDSGDSRKKPVKQRKADATSLMQQGVEQVATLLRELAAAGAATIGPDRVQQICTLGEGLRQNRLRRLSSRTIELADLLDRAAAGQASFDPGSYADLLADMLLTTRKLDKHLKGEPLDDRYVEELIGKTWREKDRTPLSGLMLVEYAFLSQTTADGFQIRESRYVEVLSGQHYSEKQILPLMLARRVEPKRSYSGQVLLGASASQYPGFAPLRIKLDSPGTLAVLGPESLEAIVARALPVGAALGAFQEQRRDVFAPDRMPVSVRADALYAERDMLRAIDDQGAGLVLPWARDPQLEVRLSSALRGVRLLALLGEIDVDDALPTLYPLAAVVRGEAGLELRPLTAAAVEGRRRRRGGQPAAAGPELGPSAWVEAARASGASAAAVALAEVRQELALICAQGLGALTARVAEPLLTRLGDLSMGKQAALLQSLVQRPAAEAAEARLEDFVKLYQVLDLALVRLCSAVHVDRAGLEPVPTYDSVHVRRIGEPLVPAEVMRRRVAGVLGRYEAAAHLARHYAGLDADQLAGGIYPTWADGSATPYVVRALAAPGRAVAAVAAAARALRGRGLLAKATAVQVLHAVATDDAQALLRRVAQGDFDNQRSYAAADFWYWERGGTVSPLRLAAQQALAAVALRQGALSPAQHKELQEQRRRHQAALGEQAAAAVSAPTQEQRRAAVWELAKLGDLAAAPTLRMVAAADEAREVRGQAVKALGLLGDAEAVDHMLGLLRQRDEEAELARAAAYGLGYLGDARGIAELLAAFVEGWSPKIVSESLLAVGGVVLAPLLDVLWRQQATPKLMERKVVGDVVRGLPAADVAQELVERLEGQGAEWAEWGEFALRVAAASPEVTARVARRVLEKTEGAGGAALLRLRQQAEQALAPRSKGRAAAAGG